MPGFRVGKPEQHGKQWRVRVFSPEGRCRSTGFATRDEAEAFASEASAQIAVDDAWKRAGDLERQAAEARAYALSLEGKSMTVRQVLEKFELAMRDKRLREISITGKLRMIRVLCRDVLDTPMSAVTAQQAQALYSARTQQQVRRHGQMQTIADATHIKELELTKEFWRHAREQGWAYSNPFADVKPIGKASRGKEQLTTPEARKLHDVMQRVLRGEAVRQNLPGSERDRALAAGLAFYVGMRGSEITQRMVVRIVSEDGTFIELKRAKTRKGERGLHVPPFLAAVLAEARKEAEARGGLEARILPHRREWVNKQAHTFCRLACVPEVCAHALRGMTATLAIEGGATWEQVVAALGHESKKITQEHYVAPDVAAAAEQRNLLRVLNGGKR